MSAPRTRHAPRRRTTGRRAPETTLTERGPL